MGNTRSESISSLLQSTKETNVTYQDEQWQLTLRLFDAINVSQHVR